MTVLISHSLSFFLLNIFFFFFFFQAEDGIRDGRVTGVQTCALPISRVRAVLRRSERPPSRGELIRVGDVELDLPRMRVTVAGRAVDLTATEFALLSTLAREPGRVFTRAQLLDAVHGVAFESYERAIDAHVKNIRRKLEPEPASPRYLLTVYGVGYRFAEVDE